MKPPTVHVQSWFTEIVWRLDWLYATLFFQKRKMSKAMARSLHSSEVISNEKIATLLHFKFQDIEEYCLEIASCRNT